MSTQISLKLSDKLFERAKAYSELKGFDNLQELIRELFRFFPDLKEKGLPIEKAIEHYKAGHNEHHIIDPLHLSDL